MAAVIDEAIAQEEGLAGAGTAASLYSIFVGRPKASRGPGRSGCR